MNKAAKAMKRLNGLLIRCIARNYFQLPWNESCV